MEKPIRILHVVTIMNLGGIETFLMSLYRNIDKNKIQFDFLVHRNEKGFFDEEIIEMGGNIYNMEPLKPLKIFSYTKSLTKFLKKSNYNIIHSHLNANNAIVLGVAKNAGIKCRISHSHANTSTNGVKGLIKNFNKLFINYTSTVRIACSVDAGIWLYGNNSEFTVLKNAINFDNFQYNKLLRKSKRQELEINLNEKLLGYVGSFNYLKNHKFLIEIFKNLCDLNKNYKLLLIGNGPLEQLIKEKVIEYKLESKVIFLGSIKNANEYLNAMDLFLFPSLSEGLGIVGIEAQTNGLPILINESLPKEIEITDNVYRLPINSGTEKWVAKIEELSNTPIDRSSVRERVKNSGYDIKQLALYIEKFYLDNNN